MDSDGELMAAIQHGNRTALATLYDRYASQMLGVAQRILQNRRDAEALLHDVFIEIWQRVGAYHAERGSVRAWIMTILRNRAIDRLRTLSVARQHTMTATDAALAERTDGKHPGASVNVMQFRQAMETLPETQRTVVSLAYFQGLTYAEIASRCAIPVGTVRSRLSSAVSRLRQAFETDGRSL